MRHPEAAAVNMHDAKTHLSKLVELAAKGETIIIARAGRAVAKLTAVDAPVSPCRLGFLKGEMRIPDDFDRMGDEEITALFAGQP